jgi:hypothetical protein
MRNPLITADKPSKCAYRSTNSGTDFPKYFFPNVQCSMFGAGLGRPKGRRRPRDRKSPLYRHPFPPQSKIQSAAGGPVRLCGQNGKWLRFENLATLSSPRFVLEIRPGLIPGNALRSQPATCRIGFVFAGNGFVSPRSPRTVRVIPSSPRRPRTPRTSRSARRRNRPPTSDAGPTNPPAISRGAHPPLLNMICTAGGSVA